jgi:hypothetical protein
MRFDSKSFLLGFAAFGLLVVLYVGVASLIGNDDPGDQQSVGDTTGPELSPSPTDTPASWPQIVTPQASSVPATPRPSPVPGSACTPATPEEVQQVVAILDQRSKTGTPAEKAIAANVRAQLDRNGDGKVDDGICHELIVQANVKLALQLPQ